MTIAARSNKIPRSAEEFQLQLDRQLSFLIRSCAAFDGGALDEAIRIALAIRLLVHDTTHSTSLLTHLGIKDLLSYVDTGVYRCLLRPALQTWVAETQPDLVLAGESPAEVGLVETGDAGEGRIGWYAPLRLRRFGPGTPPDKAMRGASTFLSWWNDPLVESSSRKEFSRSDLILIMANQDGGAHVDAGLDADYRDLVVDPLLYAGYRSAPEDHSMDGHAPGVLHNVAFASVRQIAFELTCTIERYKYVKAHPGIMILADPYKGLPIPAPPHRPVNLFLPVVLGKPA